MRTKKEILNFQFPIKKKVLIGMSGGVDSAVAAKILKDQGYDVIGVHHTYWNDPYYAERGIQGENRCCDIEAFLDARAVCDKIGIPLVVEDYSEAFFQSVVQYYLETYRQGEIPNPCIECNRSIKFGAFFESMQKFQADFISTGHYAEVIQTEEGEYRLKKGYDPLKDQSYFLYSLDQTKMAHVLFPLKGMTKLQVRRLAAEWGLDSVKEKKDSIGICFHPDGSHIAFLRRHLGESYFQPGPIRYLDGRVIGQHNGILEYTIGQRRGIDIGGFPDPVYVYHIDIENNTLWLGPRSTLEKKEMRVYRITWSHPKYARNWDQISVKIRHRTPEIMARGELISDTEANIYFESIPVISVTPGQTAVFYDGDFVVGGGVIQRK